MTKLEEKETKAYIIGVQSERKRAEKNRGGTNYLARQTNSHPCDSKIKKDFQCRRTADP